MFKNLFWRKTKNVKSLKMGRERDRQINRQTNKQTTLTSSLEPLVQMRLKYSYIKNCNIALKGDNCSNIFRHDV